jgi:hypothetical protein
VPRYVRAKPQQVGSVDGLEIQVLFMPGLSQEQAEQIRGAIHDFINESYVNGSDRKVITVASHLTSIPIHTLEVQVDKDLDNTTEYKG